MLDSLYTSISHHHFQAGTFKPRKRDLELILGTDRPEIGQEDRTLERRVAVTPEQVKSLIAFCGRLGLNLRVQVLQNAGGRAGYSDGDYIRAGADIITKEELPFNDGPPDLFHSLKEPSKYEATLPEGPFLRIGALHSGDFAEDSGFARLLQREDVIVFDGSNVGAPKSFRIPIRASMSVFAGRIAGQWTLEHLEERSLNGSAVVIGCGNAGRACIEGLSANPRVERIFAFESAQQPERLERARESFASLEKVEVVGLDGLDSDALLECLQGSQALVLAAAGPGGRAPRVVSVDALRRSLGPDGVVVDISIDERGGIEDDGAGSDTTSHDLIRYFEDRLAPQRYRAAVNMPRALPRKASQVHGEVVLPYLAALLVLVAVNGGPKEASQALRDLEVDEDSPDPAQMPDANGLFPALLQDLRSGLASWSHGGEVALANFIPAPDRLTIEKLLSPKG